MGAVVAHSAAKALSMVIAALSGVGAAVPAHTAAQDVSHLLAHVGRPTPAQLLLRLYKSALTRHAVQRPATPAKAQLMATAARNMAIVEAQAIIVAQAARLALGPAVKLRRGIHQVHLVWHRPAHQRCCHQVRRLLKL